MNMLAITEVLASMGIVASEGESGTNAEMIARAELERRGLKFVSVAWTMSDDSGAIVALNHEGGVAIVNVNGDAVANFDLF